MLGGFVSIGIALGFLTLFFLQLKQDLANPVFQSYPTSLELAQQNLTLSTLQNTMAVYLKATDDNNSRLTVKETSKYLRAQFLLVRDGKVESTVPTISCDKFIAENYLDDSRTEWPAYS